MPYESLDTSPDIQHSQFYAWQAEAADFFW